MIKKLIKILVVEDSLSDIELMKEIVSESNFDLDTSSFVFVTSGEEALNYIAINEVDFIILDLNLPKISGKEVLKFIKNSENKKQIPIIMFSSSTLQEDIADCYNSYANAYIKKPVDFHESKNVFDIIKKFWLEISLLSSGKSK